MYMSFVGNSKIFVVKLIKLLSSSLQIGVPCTYVAFRRPMS